MRIVRTCLPLIAVFFLLAIDTLAVAQEKDSTGSKQATVTGCLSWPNSEGAFVPKTAKRSRV
jgi:hypothetical protein